MAAIGGDQPEANEQHGGGLTSFVAHAAFKSTRLSAWCCLLGALIPGIAASIMGLSLLVYVLGLRSISHSWAHHVQPLYFDYRAEAATAEVRFHIPHNDISTRVANYQTRVVQPQERIGIWLALEVPKHEANWQLFHVTGELLSENGTSLALAQKPCLMNLQPGVVRMARTFLFLPMALFNRWQDVEIIEVELFNGYVDKEHEPVTGFKALLEPQYGARLPSVSHAWIHLVKHIGWIGHILLWLRPSNVPSLILGFVGLGILVSAGAMLACPVLLLAMLHVSPTLFGGMPGGAEEAPAVHAETVQGPWEVAEEPGNCRNGAQAGQARVLSDDDSMSSASSNLSPCGESVGDSAAEHTAVTQPQPGAQLRRRPRRLSH